MEKVVFWRTEDGKEFRHGCAEEAAQHEIENIEGLKERLDAACSSIYPRHQTNWCGGNPEEYSGGGAGGCACMGCANHAVYKAGFNYFHWNYWVKNLRKPHVTDNTPASSRFGMQNDYGVVITECSDESKTLMQVVKRLREVFEIDMPSAAAVMRGIREKSFPIVIWESKSDYDWCNYKIREFGAIETLKLEIVK